MLGDADRVSKGHILEALLSLAEPFQAPEEWMRHVLQELGALIVARGSKQAVAGHKLLPEATMTVFRELDLDKDGLLAPNEMVRGLKRLLPHETDARLRALVQAID